MKEKQKKPTLNKIKITKDDESSDKTALRKKYWDWKVVTRPGGYGKTYQLLKESDNIIFDEASMFKESDKRILFEYYPDAKLYFCGDLK